MIRFKPFHLFLLLLLPVYSFAARPTTASQSRRLRPWRHNVRRIRLCCAGEGQLHTVVGLHQNRFYRHINVDRYRVPFERWHSADSERHQLRPLIFRVRLAPLGLHQDVPLGIDRIVYLGQDLGVFGGSADPVTCTSTLLSLPGSHD